MFDHIIGDGFVGPGCAGEVSKEMLKVSDGGGGVRRGWVEREDELSGLDAPPLFTFGQCGEGAVLK